LTDEYPTDDIYAKAQLNVLLNNGFLEGFVSSLGDEKKNQLKDNVVKLLESHRGEVNFATDYKGLIDLAKALGVE
jgi:hypothetical protein